MINREAILLHIKEDQQLKKDLVRIIDKAEVALKRHEVKNTDFLTPIQAKYSKQILSGIAGLSFASTGGYPAAERSLISIFPDYFDMSFVEPPLAALELAGNCQFSNVSHRDYLGAILGLGLKREKLGDIILHKGEGEKLQYCHIVVSTEIKDYIIYNLDKIGSMSVSVKEISLDQIKPLVHSFRELSGSVASLRLDAVVALVCNISRGAGQALIGRDQVNVNWEVINKAAYEVSIGDVISIRGKGRFYIDNIKGLTKSGRIALQYKIPL